MIFAKTKEVEHVGGRAQHRHRVDRVDDVGVRVTYRMEITGPAADAMGPTIGPAISGDFPETLAALVERAES